MFPEGPHNTVNMILHSPHQKAAIMKALSAADVGISDIVPERKMLKLEEAPIPPELRDLFRGSGDDKFEAINIRSVHEVTVKGRKSRVVLDSSEESMGTMRLFEMIGPWIDAIQNGRVLVWDELDLRLHPLLSIFLIGLFHNSTQNKTDAQLIFTTHNTNLLDSDLLRRD
jgi:AAA15 family ATPase/GTPase